MNTESQRIAIAEKCGKIIRGFVPDSLGGFMAQLPNYPADLNAMHEAEQALGDGYKRCQYIDTLSWICRRDGMRVAYLESPFASAAQRAEGFLRVFDLWEESPPADRPCKKCGNVFTPKWDTTRVCGKCVLENLMAPDDDLPSDALACPHCGKTTVAPSGPEPYRCSGCNRTFSSQNVLGHPAADGKPENQLGASSPSDAPSC